MSVLSNKLANLLQLCLRPWGVKLTSLKALDVTDSLLANLLAEAAAAERTQRKLGLLGTSQPAATGLVFSFNRPVQLELLLRSYGKLALNPVPLIVQYGAKGEAMEAAYLAVAKLYPHVQFVKETRCRETLLALLNKLTSKQVFFLVDDIVFTRPVDMGVFGDIDAQKYIPSLRLAPHLTASYTAAMPQLPPPLRPSALVPNMLEFSWGLAGNEWDYPMSVDGHLFDTAEITVISRASAFKAPNSYEGALMRFAAALKQRPGLCFAQAVIVNNPCNKVQTEVANLAGAITPESLLARWNQGERLALEPFLNLNNTSPHQEVPLTFEPRPPQ